jgi:glutathione-regulated potassium-efflux system ancillary protein KefG
MPTPPRRALVVFAHPHKARSRACSTLLQGLAHLDRVTIHELYERYPHFVVDVRYEQKLLEDHDLIILQHPVYWYSVPALLKEWMDQVLTHGWAYGEGKRALQGKRLSSILSCGGSREAYTSSGSNRYSLRELFRPIEATAHLCGMTYLEPWVLYGASSIDKPALDMAVEELRQVVTSLLQGEAELGPSGLEVRP